jgi:tetratricopeptide (TPR) repeat protein
MFDDDFEDDELFSIEDILRKYHNVKDGASATGMDEEDFERVIEYYFQNSNDAEALLAAEIGLTQHPYCTSIMLLKAEILTQSQKYGQALKVLDELDESEEHNLDAVLLRSDIMIAQLKFDHAAQWLESQAAFFKGKDKLDLLLELSDIYDENEKFDLVFNTLVRVIEIDKRNEEALQKVCFWAEFTGRLDESVVLHTKLTDRDPYNALAWFNLGAAYQGLKMYELCIDAYSYCVAIDEKFEFAYRNMADAHMRMKEFEKAIDALQMHIEIAKPEDVIYEAMGYCFEKKKDFPKARFYYRQASILSPQDDGIFYKIGETYAREKKWDKAVKSYSVALNLNKENAAYCMALGNCLMEMNVKSEALVCYLNAVRLKPGNKTTWLALIRGLLMTGYVEEAIIQIGVAREHCGGKSEFDYYQAAALLELGKIKEALFYLEDALREAPKKLRTFTSLNAEYLLRTPVAELVSRYKKK